MSLKTVIKLEYPFMAGAAFGATADANGWKGTIVKSAGSPYSKVVTGGGAQLAGDATNEVQSAALTWGDVLTLPLSLMDRVRFEVAGSSLTGATHSTVVAGLGSALNTTLASMTNYIAFTCTGGSNLFTVSASDGTNVYTNVATGVSMSPVFSYVGIDFTQGLSDVRFYIDNGQSFRRVAASTKFNLSAAAGNYVQPVFFGVKASSTDLSTLTIRNLLIEYRSN